MIQGNGNIAVSGLKKDFAPEFKGRFVVFEADAKTSVLVDTVTGVQYLCVKPTEFSQGNQTVAISPLIDSSGFPFIDERLLLKKEDEENKK